MKIQERCCQGLSASWSSQWRTVEADTKAAMPRSMASRASSGADQRDSGTPLSAGSRQAGAYSVNRPRQVRTVSTCTPVSRVMRALERPLAA